MICVVALNPALDITHEVNGADWSGVNRPSAVHSRPGGKGLNVARTLAALGAQVRVVGLAGGTVGQAVTTELAALRVPATFVPIMGETRRTFTVADTQRGAAALFSEPGPAVSGQEWGGFCVLYERTLRGCAAVVLSGSLPPGLAPGSYAELGAMAAAAEVPVLLDAHGEALARGAAARPAIAKPNLAELEAVAGRPLSVKGDGEAGGGPGRRAVASAAAELRAAGPDAVVVTLGAHGLWAVTGEGCWQATPPRAVTPNPTGAGDAVAAGLVHGLVLGWSWAERLRHAAALGTATAAAPAAGEFSHGVYQNLLSQVRVDREAD